MSKKTFPVWILPLVAVAFGILSVWLAFQLLNSPKLSKQSINPPLDIGDFRLPATTGQTLQLRELSGKWVVVYFGYTFCPDVCPTSVQHYRDAWKLLRQPEKFQFVFITVDPERDSLTVLTEYLQHFQPDFIGLRGEVEDTAQIAKQFGAFFEKHPGSEQSGYLVDHSGSAFILNPAGQLIYTISFNTPPQEIASDLNALAQGAR